MDLDGGESSAQGGAGQHPSSAAATNSGGATFVVGTGQAGNNVNGVECKTACDPGECGPVSNRCGGFVECGGCTAPEICGGSGIPSYCGSPIVACLPKTCEVLGKTCGLQSDGCGGIVDCWSDAIKASGSTPACAVAGQVCKDGTCVAGIAECKPLTCNDYAGKTGQCGPVSDGCSGVIDCGFKCGTGESCRDSACVKLCTPVSCASASATLPAGYCDIVPDGCGGTIPNCSTGCSAGETCGVDVSGVCGPSTGKTCVPKTTADCGSTCGAMGDGCGGVVQCPVTCPDGQICGGDSDKRGQCGALKISCKVTTCAEQKAECGQISDGCDGMLPCGKCAEGTFCGSSNVCVSTSCVPKTKAEVCTAGVCGSQTNGCNDTLIECGGCPEGQSCGAGGHSLCGVGTNTCVAKTQAEICSYANSCGPQGDGCGGVVNCGSCTWPARCLGTTPTCSVPAIAGCTKLCPYIDMSCAGSGKPSTQLTGKVYAPNGTQPLYNALVYIPNAALPAITTGPTCERCQDEDLGNPIAAALTGADGTFTLNNIPAGISFPLVVKMGKWRRVVTIPAVPNCTSVALTADQTRLPRNMTDAAPENVQYVNIPRFAVVTGLVDAMECVLRKIGVSDSEFTLPTVAAPGRIQMYRAPVKFKRDGVTVSSGGGGVMGCAKFKTGSTTQCASAKDADVTQAMLSTLFNNSKLNQYDIAVMDCEGNDNDHDSYDLPLRNWANAGGRLFASHYSYKYLDDETQFMQSATWGGTEPDAFGDATTGIIDKTNPKGLALNKWLGNLNAWSPTYGDGYISITDPRHYVKSVNPGSERFIYTDTSVKIGGAAIAGANAVQQYGFNTPWGADATSICGRVLYSAFHVAGVSGVADKVFPSYCSTGPLTAQEQGLMFMIFDLSACVSVGEPPAPPTCTKNSCEALGATCGSLADGCGGLVNCGVCTAPDSCGGGGVPNQCGSNCTRTTCGAQGANCGLIADGCGGTLQCGTCDAPSTCGGGGTPNVCGSSVCTPRTCASVGAQCGFISDGCSSTIDCGTCTAPAVCGGGGKPNVCATGSCTPKDSCGTAKCGFVSDGCGDTVSCGTCPSGYSCVAGVCIGGSCEKRKCSDVGAACGFIGDGCGSVVDCGDCVAPQVCGGGGVASQCGGICAARSCAAANATCGAISDGCGGIKECGACPPGQVCGGAGVANQCGSGACVPRTCTEAQAECGSVGDGCGGVLDCGPCVAPESCGGLGVPNHCGVGGCVPLTCEEQGANCGPVANGCGGLLDCGTCPQGQTCGGGGVASRCGGIILQ